MLHRIELHKFKCYKRHNISFNRLSLVVGENNAGKSTLIEALRLVSVVTQRFKNLTFKSPPEWTGQYFNDKGVSPSVKSIEYSSDNVIYSMDDPPAKIVAIFKNRVKIIVYLNEDDRIFAQIFDSDGKIVINRTTARQVDINPIKILPQVGPLQKSETVLNKAYVLANEFTSLSSLHFRNQIQNNFWRYNDFRQLMSETWPSVSIHSFSQGSPIDDSSPALLIRDGSFVTEASKMGHGLQMWLQIIWFLLKCKEGDTVILDEPDVYLHADIQRKLIRIIKDRFTQLIVATHSIEMIAEVPSEDILIIDKSKVKSKYATNNLAVQEIVESIGSIHNIELIRLWSSQRFLIFEGDNDDIKYLKAFQDVINPKSELPIDNIPHTYTDGWGGWQRVVGAHRVISKNSNVSTYCIFDSDYHTKEDIDKRYAEAKETGVNIHIWSKKEIENYLINLEVIYRYLNSISKVNVDKSKILKALETICDDLHDDVFDCFAVELQSKDRSKTVKTVNNKVREIMNERWTTLDSKLSVVSGKIFLKKLSKWCQDTYQVSIQKLSLAREFGADEISDEIKNVINSIEQKNRFDS